MRIPLNLPVLLVIPLLLVAWWVVASDARGPYHLGRNSDPEYCYLFNSLNVATLHYPTHTDHPGTTLQELGAAVLLVRAAAARLGGNEEPLAVSVVRDPESALFSINVVLGFLLIGLLAALSWRALSLTGSLIPPLALQFSFLTFGLLLAVFPRVSPEPVLVSAVLALAFVLAPGILGAAGGEALSRPQTALLAGVVLGFGVVTKVTFLPLLLLIFVFPGRRQRIRCAVAGLLSAGVFLLPIVTQLPRVLNWLLRLATHQGRYGSGASGLPESSAYLRALARLFHGEPLLFWTLALFVTAAAVWRFGPKMSGEIAPAATRRCLALGIAAIVATIAITAKHPAGHYLVPAAALAPVLMMMLADHFRRQGTPPLFRAFAAAGVLLIVAGVAFTAGKKIENVRANRGYQKAVMAELQEVKRHPTCAVAGVYRSSLLSSALALGNDFSSLVHAPVLEQFYPGWVHYNRFSGRFRGWGWTDFTGVVRASVERGDCVLLQGEVKGIDLETQYRFETIATSRWEQLVQLRPLSSGF